MQLKHINTQTKILGYFRLFWSRVIKPSQPPSPSAINPSACSGSPQLQGDCPRRAFLPTCSEHDDPENSMTETSPLKSYFDFVFPVRQQEAVCPPSYATAKHTLHVLVKPSSRIFFAHVSYAHVTARVPTGTAALPPLPFHALSRPANRGQAHSSCVGRCGARGRLSFVPSHQLTLGDEFTASRRVCCFAAPLSPISQTALALHARRPASERYCRSQDPLTVSPPAVCTCVPRPATGRPPASPQGTGRLPP
jgi:hypothetical protein